MRVTLIRAVPSCDELCLRRAVAVLPVRRSFLTDRPLLVDTSRAHCRASGKIGQSSDEAGDLLVVRLRSKSLYRYAKCFIKHGENVSKETVIQ
jgi:hypothetical protein